MSFIDQAGDRGVYVFSAFRLDPAARVLMCHGEAVGLPPRLFDTLAYLVEHAGRVVAREELLRAVWDNRVVDDSNIKQTIFALRKTLQACGCGERLIVTATRGYLFAAAVQRETGPPDGERGVTHAAQDEGARVRPSGRLRLFALTVVVSLACAWFIERPGADRFAPPAHSVAVLAFTNLSGDPAQSYFAEGIADELTGVLSRIPGVRVAGRQSAFSFRGKPATVGEIGRKLNVGAILEGSVRRAGARVRITVALVETVTGFTIWTQTADRDGGDILQAQADIAGAVASALRVVLLGADAAKLVAGGTANPAAFDAYLRAAGLAEAAADGAALRGALADFDRAIALDPGFALARARRSHALLVLANTAGGPDLAAVRTTLAEAIAEARRAVALTPTLGLAHLSLGAALMSVQDLLGADREFALAHRLAPGDARITMDFALAQIQFGRVSAGVAAAQEAAELDPLTPGTYLYLASVLLDARDFQQARAALRRARLLGAAAHADGIERAIALQTGDYRTAMSASADGKTWRDVVCLALALHGLGRATEAEAQLARLHTLLGDTGAYQYAEIYAQWGQTQQAVMWLRTAYDLHDPGLILMKSDPLLAPIRNTPQFGDITRLLNYP